MKYLSAEEILFIHSVLIDETGGTHGVRDLGLLKSAVARPQMTFGGKDLHHSLEEKAAALFLGLLKNHPFIDGNKRTALTAFGVFLELNGRRLDMEPLELADFVEHLAAGHETPRELLPWIRLRTTRSKS